MDPYAPAAPKVAVPRPKRAPRYPPVLRMRKIGITPAEEREACATWAAMTDDEKFELLEAWNNVTDAELKAMVAADRARGDDADDLIDAAAVAEVVEVLGGTIDSVLAWVNLDRDRARLAYEYEADKGPDARSTLLGKLRQIIDYED